MAFFLEKAIFINRAPFEHLELDFKEKGINVLAAINGKGKTTILSYIADSFHELARHSFPNEYEGIENAYYRYSSPLETIERDVYSVVFFRFRKDTQIWDYVDVRNVCTKEQFDNIISGNKISYNEIKDTLAKVKNIKKWSADAKKENIVPLFSDNLITYFPAYRYEDPGYLNNPYKFELSFKKDFVVNGYLPNDIEVISDLRNLSNWLMDIVLDYHLYKTNETILLRKNFNHILSNTLSSKVSGNCRIGIGPRYNAGSRISIVQDKPNDVIDTIYPTIFNISSGEAAMLCLFGEILHQADKIGKLLDVTGIVLIDEVDKHLHIKLQKEILPKLFALFPNIQFIVSSHSPFLNMGLADEAMERTQIMDLDNNGIVCEPTNNDLYKEVYEMMITENHRFASKYKDLKAKVESINKPLIITEGKTDWKHFKAALTYFKEKKEYEDVEIEICEYNENMGDQELDKILSAYAKMPITPHQIIGIFDCDEGNGRKIHKAGGTKQYGNNIWGVSIPIPDFRNYNTEGISVEFLYKNEDLQRQDENGRRIYVTWKKNLCNIRIQ